MTDKPLADLDPAGAPRDFGPYRVIRKIGSGGMGVVYQGEHKETGDLVAIKTVLVESDPRYHKHLNRLVGIRREIHALRRVQHPGIVCVVDTGVTDGLPWVAMPLLQGRTLKAYLETRQARPAGESATFDGTMLTLICRLCATLAFLHGEGLVHRDLKPDNIFLQNDGRPILFDLGLAVHFGGVGGREELHVEQAAGTLDYMAPEQLRGELVDARADLYALGCILYECVTGQPPFTGESYISIYNQHLNHPPIQPSRLVSDLPPKLNDLILKLLEKLPQDRIGSAVDVATELVALDAEVEPNDGPPPRAYLYRPQIAGRADALATLKTAVRAAGQRRGGLALVYGESGVGKTRLAREVIIRATQWLATEEQLIVRTGSCVAPGAGEAGATAAVASPLHPLRSVLATAADRARKSRAESDRLFGPRGKVLSAYAPDLLDLPGQAEQPPPPFLPPDKARARVISALQETLCALAKLSPLLIVLDDLQWADDLTLSLLASLTKAGPHNYGILIVATYRSEEQKTRPELTALAGLPGVTSIPLGRLDAESVEKMVLGMLGGSTPPRAVLDVLNRYSEGNPFFVAEYLLAAIEEKILRRDENGRLCFDARDAAGALLSMPLPHTLENLVARRLKRLNAEERALAEWAAVLGQELDDDLLLSGAHRDDAVMDALAALKARHILEETEEGKLRFVHDKIREIAYQRIAFDARAELHQRAGEALKARYAEVPDDKAPTLGYHFTGAGRHDDAGKYFAQAARRAQEVYANGDAIRFYRAAIDALTRALHAETKLAENAALHESLGDVLGLIGHQEEARGAYQAALDATSPAAHLALAQLHRKSGKTWEMHHYHAEALELYAQAEAALGESPALPAKPPRDGRTTAPGAGDHAKAWLQEWILIQLDRISVHYWRGDIELLCKQVEALRPMVEQQGTALHRAHYVHALTQRNIRVERYVASSETVRYARECVTAYEAAGEAPEGHWVLAAKGSLAIILVLHEAFKKAEKPMSDALQAAEKIGDLEVQTRCLTYLTVIHRRLRQLDLVEETAQKSLRLATAEQIHEYAGAAWGNLAWIALQRGADAKAEQAGRVALSLWKPLAHVYPFQWLARLPLCYVELTQDRLEGAIEQAQAVLDIRQQRLPKRLTAALEEAVTAFTQGYKDRAKSALLRALLIGLQRGYV